MGPQRGPSEGPKWGGLSGVGVGRTPAGGACWGLGREGGGGVLQLAHAQGKLGGRWGLDVAASPWQTNGNGEASRGSLASRCDDNQPTRSRSFNPVYPPTPVG